MFTVLDSRMSLGMSPTAGLPAFRVFGFVARGEDQPESDVDLVVDMASGRSLQANLRRCEDRGQSAPESRTR